MNILYNRPITGKELELFKLVEEFVYANLNDKSLFYRITLDFTELDEEENSLKNTSSFRLDMDNYLKTYITIPRYMIKLFSNSCARLGEQTFDNFENLRLSIIFHELGHLTQLYNDPEKFRRERLVGHGCYLVKKDEKLLDKMADEFLKSKGIY